MNQTLHQATPEPMFDRATIAKYRAEYERLNPYGLPELSAKPRRRRIVRRHCRELVFSARPY